MHSEVLAKVCRDNSRWLYCGILRYCQSCGYGLKLSIEFLQYIQHTYLQSWLSWSFLRGCLWAAMLALSLCTGCSASWRKSEKTYQLGGRGWESLDSQFRLQVNMMDVFIPHTQGWDDIAEADQGLVDATSFLQSDAFCSCCTSTLAAVAHTQSEH